MTARETLLRGALHERLALLELLDEQAGVTECDPQGRITRVNERFERLSGYAAAELLGRDHRLLASGRHDHAFWQAVWARIGAGKLWHGELCNRAKDGRLFWEDTVIAPLPGPDGGTVRYIAVRRDISAAKQAEAELRTSRALLARTGELAGVGGWVLEPARRRLLLSEEARRILGPEVAQDLSLDEAMRHVSTADWLTLRAALESAALRRRPFDRVVQLAGRPGRWVRVVGETETAGGSEPPRIIGALQDISALTLAQRQAEASERTLRSAIEALGEAFALYDAEERLLFCNERYRQLCGVPRRQLLPGLSYEDVLQLTLRSAQGGPAVADPQAWIAEQLRRFRQKSSDSLLPLRDGRWIRAINRGTADGLHVVFRLDVTEGRRRLEAAGAAARSKSQFLANMSHEIRTPLNAVLGMLQLLAGTRLDAGQAELLDKAEGAARHLLDLLNSILDYSKAEAGQMVLDPQPFELPRLLRELRALLAAGLDGRPLTLEIEADPRLPAWLLGDALRLQQVLINLGGNAIKFTERGTVRLCARLLDEEAQGLRVEFSVSDTGIGIPPAQQRRIFDAFSQAEASTSRRYGGTGLGLAISQRLVQLMGGELRLHSEPGQGSRFFFDIRLARAAAPPAAPPRPRAAGPRLQGLSLLLVEDNPLNREVAQRLLRREGARVDCAADGRQGLAALRAADYDLVLMDMQMPGMDGLQATRVLRREPRWAGLPVLALTANAGPADHAACRAAGMNGHVGKPFDLDELVAAILALRGGAAPPQTAGAAPSDQPAATAPGPAPLLDSEAALARLAGDEDFYADLLQAFAPQARRLLERLLASADRDAAHQLKSSAAALGAQRLAAACAAAEAGRFEPQDLRAELEAALQAQSDWLARRAPTATAAPAEVAAALRELADSLERSALDCFERYEQLLAAHGRALGAAPGAALDPLRAAMDDFETEAAAAACHALLRQLDADPTPPRG